jgi:hypothetical protein
MTVSRKRLRRGMRHPTTPKPSRRSPAAASGWSAARTVRPAARGSVTIVGELARGAPTAQVRGVKIPGPTRRSDDLMVKSCTLAGTSSPAKLGPATPAGGAELSQGGSGRLPGRPQRAAKEPSRAHGLFPVRPPRTGFATARRHERSGRGRGRRRTLWQGGLCDVDFGHGFWTPIGAACRGEGRLSQNRSFVRHHRRVRACGRSRVPSLLASRAECEHRTPIPPPGNR